MGVRGFKVLGGVVAAVLVAIVTALSAPTDDAGDQPDAGVPPAAAQRSAAPSGEAKGSKRRTGRVEQVVDGDTLRVRTTEGTERVRLIGIDAPELSTTRTGYAECGAPEAFAQLSMLTPKGSTVALQTDTRQDARDRFGRLLAYVTPAGARRTAQEELLAAGWVRVYVYDRRPFVRVDAFRALAAEARTAHVGVWDECGGRFDRPAR